MNARYDDYLGVLIEAFEPWPMVRARREELRKHLRGAGFVVVRAQTTADKLAEDLARTPKSLLESYERFWQSCRRGVSL